MANPIFTFQNKNTKNRYFLLWNTQWGVPKTIPMNLLTFLQYWGIRDKEKISVLYSIYPRLIETGTSLNDSSFNEIPDYLKELCFDCLEFQIDTPSNKEFELNQDLEDLFANDLGFFEFYSQYVKLVSDINRFPRRPKDYYLSWSRTLDVLNISKSNIQGLFHTAAEENGVHASDLNFDTKNINSWLECNIFERFPEVMVDFFAKLAKSNLIAIDAIPHVMRNDQSIKELFNQFAMEAYVPEANVANNVFDLDQPVYELVKDERFLRQFANLLTFDGLGFDLMGLKLLDIPNDELTDILHESHYIYNLKLVNFRDNKGCYLLPMKYTNDFYADPNEQFLFLAPFGQQAYHVVNKFGEVIDTSGYYDFHIFGNVGYMQCSEKLTWIRWSYDEETNAIDKQQVYIEDEYQEGIWELTEQRFQQTLLENNNENILDKFELLELVFGKQDDQYSIYLTMPNQLNSGTIKSEIIFHLNQLLEKGIDISDSYTASFALYKNLLNSLRAIKFITPSLNVFYLVDSSTKVTSKFVNNYHNEDFLEELNNRKVSDRSVISHLSLILIQERGHYSNVYQYHFRSNVSAFIFQKDCEEFVKSNPLIPESDLGVYAAQFLNFLIGKGYQRVNIYTQSMHKNELSNLIGVELNHVGRFDIPERQFNETDDEDDLPF